MQQQLSARARRALRNGRSLWAGFAHGRPDAALAAKIGQMIRSKHRLCVDLDIVVTESGFVTMALLPPYGCEIDGSLVVPGIDDRGTRGFLVMHVGRPPFHSLADTAGAAAREADASAARAARLVDHFGGAAKLWTAAKTAPWYLLSRSSDLDQSGLCLWGVYAFLRRYGLLKIVRSQFGERVGIPRLLFRAAGRYGDRVTAATLYRRQRMTANWHSDTVRVALSRD